MTNSVIGRDTFIIWKVLTLALEAEAAGVPVRLSLGDEREDIKRLLDAIADRSLELRLAPRPPGAHPAVGTCPNASGQGASSPIRP